MIYGHKMAIDARMIECSGIGTYIQHLLGHGIYDIAVGSEKVIRKYNADIKVIEFESSIYGLKGQLCFPFRKLRKVGVELIHFPHYNVPFLCTIPFVVTVHDLIHFVYPEFLGSKIKLFYAKILMMHALIKSKHIFTVSECSKKDIENYFRIDTDKITVAYNAVDEDFRVEKPEKYEYLYEKYGIDKSKKIILYVGNMKPHKNLHGLLDAFAMAETLKESILILAGKAFKGEKTIEKIENQLGIKKYTVHTGLINKDELVDIYNLADVFVFPSLYEGFGLPVLEAMACGTPVICSNTSSLPEVVGNAAVMVNPLKPENIAMEIDKMLTNHETAQFFSELGLQKAKEYSWNENIKLISEFIENFLCDRMLDE